MHVFTVGATMSTLYPLGIPNYATALKKISEAKPDIVWLMTADSPAFIRQFASYGISSQLVATGSFGELMTTLLAKEESFPGFWRAARMRWPELYKHSPGTTSIENIIVNQSYFTSLNTRENNYFLKSYRAQYGADAMVDSVGETTYSSVWLYAKAVEKAGSTDTEKVR